MIEKDGIRSLWRGLSPTLWRDVPFSAYYWLAYERSKQKIKSFGVKSNYIASFVAGAASGMTAAALTTPFDVAKTRSQIDGSQNID